MAFIAQIKEITKRLIKIDSGGGNIVSAERYRPAGLDSTPLDSDYAAADDLMRAGNTTTIGFIDTKNDPKSDKGETRLYARQSDGTEIAEIWVKNTGEINIKNNAGEIKLLPNGDANINGTIFKSGGIVTCNSITIGGIIFGAHVHGGVASGTNNTGTPI